MPKIVFALALLLLSGCSLLVVNSAPQMRQSLLPAQWQLTGKLASSGLGAAQFSWLQTGADSQIQITAPLGAGAARLVYQRGQLRVKSGKQNLNHAESLHWLQARDLALPYAAMALWLQGLPYSKMPYRVDDDNNVFEQAGWRITVTRWQQQSCVQLPSRLQIEKGDLRLKLGGLRWHWGAAENAKPSLFTTTAITDCASET